jgi:dTDP-glucose 4,6-dehydratase
MPIFSHKLPGAIMENILITGGAGFIGSNFIHYLLRHDHKGEVVNLDLLTYAGSLENLKDLPAVGKYTFCQGDIGDVDLVDQIMTRHQIDTIVHFAAETHVDRSILGPEAFIQTNVVGTFRLLEAARSHWLDTGMAEKTPCRFHLVSTDEVYGSLEANDPAFTEATNYAPNSPYAASKAACDHLARAYHHTYGLPVSITNCSNNYGPRQFPEKLIPLMILNAWQGKPLPVYGDGNQIRDWLFVTDHCQAILNVIQHGAAGETYIVGGNNQPTNLEVIHTICSILDRLLPESPFVPHRSLITFVQDRPGHDRRYAMNIEKISRELGWQPSVTLETGLEKTVLWYLDNLDWVESIMDTDFQDWIDKNYGNRENRRKAE